MILRQDHGGQPAHAARQAQGGCPNPAGRRKRARGVWAAVLLGCSTACGSDATEPNQLDIVAAGRLERGQSLLLRLVSASQDTVPVGSVTWSVDPASAGEWKSDSLRLAEAGTITVTAQHNGGWHSQRFEVAVPPVVLIDMVVDGNRDIYQVAIDGSDLIRLTTHPAADSDPTVARGTVVFLSERDGNAELYSMPLAGGQERRLTRTAARELHPALSPDGVRLAFVRGTDLTRMFVANADATGATRPDPTHGHDGTLENAPAWHPDNRTLAFVSTARGNPDLFRWASGTAAVLEASSGGEFEPAWSPDGRRLAFASSRSGDVELYVLNPDNGAVTRLTDRPGSDGFPAWLPDGRIVYVSFNGVTPTLRWLDPAYPGNTHLIPLPGEPGNPIALPR